MNTAPKTGSDWLRIIFMGLLWLIVLAALVSGLALFLYSVSQWLDDGGAFVGLDGFFDGFFAQIGAGITSAGLIGAAALLRFSRFAIAPTISLVVSVAGFILVLACYWVFAGVFNDELAPRFILMFVAFVSLFAICLPPFLHWRASRQPAATASAHPAKPEKPA